MDAGFAGFAAFFASRLRPNSLNQREISVIYSRQKQVFRLYKSRKSRKSRKIRYTTCNAEICGLTKRTS